MAGLLPVGSIIKLSQSSEVCYMISGYYPMHQGNMWEYSAVLYPGGLSGTAKLEMLNQEQIEEVLFEGFQNEETRRLLERIPEFMAATSMLIQESNQIIEQSIQTIGEKADELEKSTEINIQME